MTIKEAIERTDEMKPNGYQLEQKIEWLNQLEAMVYRFIVLTHEGGEPVRDAYTLDTDENTVLFAPEPFDAIYLRWLEAQIDLSNQEYEGYNVSIKLFNNEYENFENDYHRNHRPLQRGKRFRF